MGSLDRLQEIIDSILYHLGEHTMEPKHLHILPRNFRATPDQS